MGGGPPLPSPPHLVVKLPEVNLNVNRNISVNSSINSITSKIVQLDGVDSIVNDSISSDEDLRDDSTSDISEYATDDEIEPLTSPIPLTPASKPNKRELKIIQAASLPLITVMKGSSLNDFQFSLIWF